MVENITLSLRQQVREKRLTADLWMLREAIADGALTSLKHTPTKYMLADALTKTKVDANANIMLHDVMSGTIKLYIGPPHSSNQHLPEQHVPRRSQDRKGESGVDVKMPNSPSSMVL